MIEQIKIEIFFLISFSPFSDSPLLDEKNPLLRRFELTDTFRGRTEIDSSNRKKNYLIHKREQQEYKIPDVDGEGDITFLIGKIFLWIYQSGMAFLTVDIIPQEESPEKILDLFSKLNTLQKLHGRKKYKIVYQQEREQDLFSEESFDLRDILRKIIEDQKWINFHPYKDLEDNFNKKHNLFFGIVDEYTQEEWEEFSETLHLRADHFRLPDLEENVSEKITYGQWRYVKWNVAETMMSVIGNLREAKYPKNQNYLSGKEQSPFQDSVFQNYLPVYLYYLSLYMGIKGFKNQKLKNVSKKRLFFLQNLTELPLRNILSQNDDFKHIRKLFETYLDGQVLQLTENMLALKKNIIIFDRGSLGKRIYESGKYVFISYSSKDDAKVEEICGLLCKRNIPYWKSASGIMEGAVEPGEFYAAEITDGITNCGCVLLCLTEKAQASRFVSREVSLTADRRKTCIPVILEEDYIYNGDFEYLVKHGWQATPVSGELNEKNFELKQVIDKIQENLGGTSTEI